MVKKTYSAKKNSAVLAGAKAVAASVSKMAHGKLTSKNLRGKL